ncbi:MAG: hypothetical protein JRJ03_05910 [Deltaproteobacteria bacterium]|nr:hypothetical protein [Deltaproteobacteria bacterium]
MILIPLLWMAIFLFGCDSNRLEKVPDEMKGEWMTSAPKYKGFSFEISDQSLVFIDQNAEQPVDVYPISKIEKDEEEKNLYTIYYKVDDSADYKFSFYFDPADGGSIILKNQRKYLWKKVNKKRPTSR